MGPRKGGGRFAVEVRGREVVTQRYIDDTNDTNVLETVERTLKDLLKNGLVYGYRDEWMRPGSFSVS